jgi:hypothetical protein
MRFRTLITAAGAAAILGCTAAAVLPAAASARTTTHTLKFVSVTQKMVTFSKTNLGQQDTDVNSKGKTVGFDMLNITVNPKTNTGTILFTVNAAGGFLIGYLPYSTKTTLTGTVTGGVGTYKGAFGKIVAKVLNKARTKVSVTITYQT